MELLKIALVLLGMALILSALILLMPSEAQLPVAVALTIGIILGGR
jgi:hypothetical protein